LYRTQRFITDCHWSLSQAGYILYIWCQQCYVGPCPHGVVQHHRWLEETTSRYWRCLWMY